jgi:hypothetical protein
MRTLLRYALLLSAAQLVASCQQEASIRPTNYDELALSSGHWEWDSSTLGWPGNRTPATMGYSRQLIFRAGGQLVLRRSGQDDYYTSYQLSMGPLPRCGHNNANFPIITYSTNEEQLPNNARKTYVISQQQGQQLLTITGEDACVDGGISESYHWVPE